MNDTIDSVTDALQPAAWIRKNGFRFIAEAEPQDDSETALYSQTAIDTLRAQLAEAQARVADLTGPVNIADAAYIAAANPATVLALLDEVEAAHASRREAQARVAELTEKVQALGRKLHRHKLDTARLDWLADRENAIGNVQLPTECVQAHPESLRAAIDAAMSMEGGAA